MPNKINWKRIFYIFVIIGMVLGIYAFGIEPNRLVIKEVELELPHWLPEHNGLRMAVLADLHVGAPHIDLDKVQEVVERTNQLKPDVVVILGDFVVDDVLGGKVVAPEDIARVLQGLQARLGIVSILGNHDWYIDGGRMRKTLANNGQIVLENQAVAVTHKGKSFWMAGIGDLWTRPVDIPGTLAQVKDDEPVILLSHNPDVFPDVPNRVSLTLAGHTHGGQVFLPILGRLIVPSEYGQRFAAGHVVEEGRHLFVGTGIGTSILPVRFRVAPEILLLTLNAQSQGAQALE